MLDMSVHDADRSEGQSSGDVQGGGTMTGMPQDASLALQMAQAVHQAMELALAHHRAGELSQAEEAYRAILELAPDHADANHNLAVIALQVGQAQASLPHFQAAVAMQPDNDIYWCSLFDAMLQAGALLDATELLERRCQAGIPIDQANGLVERIIAARYSRIADSATQRGAPRAQAAAKDVSEIKAMFQAEHLEQVVSRATQLTMRFPQDAFGWKALGAALVNLGRCDDALEPLKRAVDCAPRDASAMSNLGFALQNQGRPIEAEVNLRLALMVQPGFAAALINLGATMLSQTRYDDAVAYYRRGLEIEPGYIPAHSHLAQVEEEKGCLVLAAEGYRRALGLLERSGAEADSVRLKEAAAYAHQGLSSTLAKLADFDQVCLHSDAAIALRPQDRVLWEKRLYALSYHPDLPVEDIYAEFVRWGDGFPAPVTNFQNHDRSHGRRLRIGYVSPDFRRHTSRFYFWPLFANHDPQKVELFAYSNVRKDDEFTGQFRTAFHHWRDIRQLSDAEAAALIQEDQIDILVDGCNHMRDDRLGIFALKPAPVQVTWLGAAWTTGLASVDYVFFDPYIAPPQTIARESIVRLPHCFVPFQGQMQTGLPKPPPCLRNGYVTFGYSGRTERLNHRTFRAWAQILQRLPDARLILDFKNFVEPQNREYYLRLLREEGVDTGRVDMRNSPDIFVGLHDFDVLLDSFPHSGGTMLVDALWMGVPTLTMAGRPPLGRIGSTFMMNLELPDWIANDETDFVDKAVAFASDVDGLVRLRAGMRERMRHSPLMDGPAFARAVEWAFDAMWARYCKGLGATAIEVPSLPRGL